jgi:hypothetical protein
VVAVQRPPAVPLVNEVERWPLAARRVAARVAPRGVAGAAMCRPFG